MNSNDKEQRIAAKLFGAAGKAQGKNRKNRRQVVQELLSPFEWEKALIRNYCKQCDTILEVNSVLMQELAREGNVSLPRLLDGLYLEQEGCLLCSSSNSGIALKKIADLVHTRDLKRRCYLKDAACKHIL